MVEGLEKLHNLEIIDLSNNYIQRITPDCDQLKDLRNIQTIDLQHNQIDDGDNIIPFFEGIPHLLGLLMKGNPAVRKMKTYRRGLLISLPKLTYLDDKPVFEVERLGIDAFLRGGVDEEKRVRQEHAKK